jgi:hypothetical protein
MNTEGTWRVIAPYVVCLTPFFVGCRGGMTSPSATTNLGVEATPLTMEQTLHAAPDNQVTQQYTAADMDLIPRGSECEVKLTTGDRTITGKVESVKNGAIVMRDATEITLHTSEQGVPILNRIPFASKRFRNVGAATTTRELGNVTLSAFEVDRITAHLTLSVPAEHGR